ncbi:MAG: NAD-binding protein [Casimicrobiaceae bacterium]
MLIRAPDRTRAWSRRAAQALGMRYWFPQVPLALLLALGGGWLLDADAGSGLQQALADVTDGHFRIAPRMLPSLLLGSGMLTMALGLLLRSRVAWTMSLLLAITAAISTRFTGHAGADRLLAYFVILLIALSFAWRSFDRSSVAASTLFALTSVAMLLMYATFGSYYLGAEYKPPITDLVTALYYSMVTMSAVGYGDITPQTSGAMLFTVSIIVLGVAVFATSLSVNTWRELVKRGLPVTRLVREAPAAGTLEDADVVVGDPSSVDVLRQAGADRAEAVLATLDDDSENAFVVLAVKELGSTVRTIAAVNDARHLSRVELVQPDMVIAPQVLGGELTAMLLSGEAITPDFVMERFVPRQRGRQTQ